jgi:hypothetical protein
MNKLQAQWVIAALERRHRQNVREAGGTLIVFGHKGQCGRSQCDRSCRVASVIEKFGF